MPDTPKPALPLSEEMRDSVDNRRFDRADSVRVGIWADRVAALESQLADSQRKAQALVAAAYRDAGECLKEVLEVAEASKANRGDEWDDIARHLLIRLLFDIQKKIQDRTPTDARAALDRMIAEAKAPLEEQIKELRVSLNDRRNYTAMLTGELVETKKQLAAAKADRDRAVWEARLEEAKWWEHLVTEIDHAEPDCMYCARIAALEAVSASAEEGKT